MNRWCKIESIASRKVPNWRERDKQGPCLLEKNCFKQGGAEEVKNWKELEEAMTFVVCLRKRVGK